MTNYILFRHGSNAANQSMTQTAVVGSIMAKTRQDAREKGAELVTVYSNQRIEARPASRCSRAAIEEAQYADMARAEWNKYRAAEEV